MSYCLAIDPGVKASGVCLYTPLNYTTLLERQYGVISADWVRYDKSPVAAAEAIFAWLDSHQISPSKVVIEVPQVYSTRHQKGDQQDLIDLALVAGAIAASLASPLVEVSLVRPREWKGGMDKSVTKARVDRALSDAEKARIRWPASSYRHNVYDAIHLALRTWDKRRA